MIIPTVIGIFAAKWITNSWQKQKDKAEIALDIFDLFDEYFMEYLTFMSTSLDEQKQYHEKLHSILKTDLTTLDKKQRDDLKSKSDELFNLNYRHLETRKEKLSEFNARLKNVWKLESRLRVCYANKGMDTELTKLMEQFTKIINFYGEYTDVITNVIANVIANPTNMPGDFEENGSDFNKNLNDFIEKSDAFKRKLLKIQLAT